MPSAIVLGAGIVGVCTALCLRERGWEVLVVDRTGVGLETSFGNAGLIQADMPEPYRMPRSMRVLTHMARGRDNDVHYRLHELPSHVPALAQYWWHSATPRFRAISQDYSKLVATATQEHQRWIVAAAADCLIKREGYRVLFRSSQCLENACSEAARMQCEYGLPYRMLSPRQLLDSEPALCQPGLGAIQYQSAWTVSDPGGLVAAYGKALVRAGGGIAIGEANSVNKRGSRWSVHTAEGPCEAEHLVIALGPWSPAFCKRFGRQITMLYKRGYHVHVQAPSDLFLPLIDVEKGYVLAPMKAGIRITTGVHIARLDAPVDPVQLHSAEATARDLILLGERRESTPWMGTRPLMPDMLPVVGRLMADPSVWANFGHGHQGLTIAPSTGRMLAERMNRERPFVEDAAYAPTRLRL